MGKRQCSYCGAFNPDTAELCSNCREPLVEVPHVHSGISVQGMAQIRRGVIYILMAAGLHYVAAGHTGLQMPMVLGPVVNTYVIPLLFLCGAGLVLLGLFRRVAS